MTIHIFHVWYNMLWLCNVMLVKCRWEIQCNHKWRQILEQHQLFSSLLLTNCNEYRMKQFEVYHQVHIRKINYKKCFTQINVVVLNRCNVYASVHLLHDNYVYMDNCVKSPESIMNNMESNALSLHSIVHGIMIYICLFTNWWKSDISSTVLLPSS